MSTATDTSTSLKPTDVRAIEQRIAKELIDMVRRHKPLNVQEQRLMDSICAEIGTKYDVLPPQEGFKIERLEEMFPDGGEWF